MLDYAKIGAKIRTLRKSQNMSQEQLAEKVWISTTHMSHIETGSTKLSLPVLVDLANALGVGTDTILESATEGSVCSSGNDITSLLKTCTPQQAAVLEEIIISAKKAMDTYF